MKSVLSDAIENDFVEAVKDQTCCGPAMTVTRRSGSITHRGLPSSVVDGACVHASVISGEIISGATVEIISSTRAAGARLGPAQSPRPIQHTHDTVTRRGRAHVPRSSSVVARSDLGVGRIPIRSIRPAPRAVLGSRILCEKNLSIPGRRSIMHHFNYYHLKTNAMIRAMMSP